MTDNAAMERESAPVGDQECDFCGVQVSRVRRIALDGEYERLRTPHSVRYACPECSERKERERFSAS